MREAILGKLVQLLAGQTPEQLARYLAWCQVVATAAAAEYDKPPAQRDLERFPRPSVSSPR